MAKRKRQATPIARPDGDVGPRQPCPCGSGKRYKACHGAPGGSVSFVVRSFEGLPGECDWVALREFVQAGTAPLALRPDAYDGAAADAVAQAVTVLPGIAPALRREDGAVWLGVQVAHRTGDASADLAAALGAGLALANGESLTTAAPGGPTRLQDVIDPDASFEITLHDSFAFWFEGVDDTDGTIAASLEQLNDTLEPTARLRSVDAAYWVHTGTKEHLRWVLPHDEDALLSALARLHVAGADGLSDDSRLVGSFRAYGLLVPVWDLPVGTGAEALEEPATAFAARLGDAVADGSPLSAAERAARSGLANRQLTIR